MQHIRICDYDVPGATDGFSGCDRGITVKRIGPDIHFHQGDDVMKFLQLILGKRLGGKKINRPAFRIIHDAVQNGQIISQGLATGSRRHQGDILAFTDCLIGFQLMRIKFCYPLLPQCVLYFGI